MHGLAHSQTHSGLQCQGGSSKSTKDIQEGTKGQELEGKGSWKLSLEMEALADATALLLSPFPTQPASTGSLPNMSSLLTWQTLLTPPW